MRARGIIGGLGLLAGLGAFFLPKVEPIQLREAQPRFKRSHQRINNRRGSVPNRGLKRIQGRQAAR